MKYVVEFLEEKLKVKPKKVSMTSLEMEFGNYIGESVYVDECENKITIYYTDYIKWLESKIKL